MARGEKIGGEDVNRAAGELGQFKEEDFRRVTGPDDRVRLERQFQYIIKFCTEDKMANCILVERDIEASSQAGIDELVDLKFLHRVRSRVTVRDRVGRLYDAFMLDLSRYTGSRGGPGRRCASPGKLDLFGEKVKQGSHVFVSTSNAPSNNAISTLSCEGLTASCGAVNAGVVAGEVRRKRPYHRPPACARGAFAVAEALRWAD